MGATAATLWFIDVAEPKGILAIAGRPDEAASRVIAEQVLGGPVAGRPESLARAAAPLPGHVYVAAWGGLTVVAHEGLRVDRPSELDDSWWNLLPAHRTFLLVADPERAVGGFALRSDGAPKRTFAAHPVDILEDEGLPERFEGPFWAGAHPLTYAEGAVPDPRALPFHPMEFAEQANREILGFRYTHPLDATDLDPARIQVIDFVLASEIPEQAPPAPVPGADGAPYPPVEQPQDAGQDDRGKVRSFFGF
ncbi:DUF6928 family protein [Tsukamurella spumae]|uniref:Uncharacterized protein n=1 Tax=Tsukamurella spumae TaxID=44753 RepID=A0A846X6I3_9ACTN|nr:hypothetical protein [Tsukamurella spumae]NKY20681.1 hypothetical protein [Tsukamurella spumae]